MPVCTFSQTVDLPPADFCGDPEQKAREKFVREIEGKCLKDHGEVAAVLKITNTEQKPLLSSGHARYVITCQAEVYRVVPGDIVRGLVTRSDGLVTVIEARSVSVCIPAHFHKGEKAVPEGTQAAAEVLAVRFEGGKFTAIGRLV